MVDPRLFERPLSFLKIRPAFNRHRAKLVQCCNELVEIERLRNLELIHRNRVSQKRQKIDFRGAQIDFRRFQIRRKLGALQLHAPEIYLRDVARLEPILANRDSLS